MDLETLISGLDIRAVDDRADLSAIRVCDLTEDSRTAVPGSLFIARAGLVNDGRGYISDAVECGAVAVLTDSVDAAKPVRPGVVVLIADDLLKVSGLLAERFWGNPGEKLAIAGVTGTNGKTTIAHFIHQLIRGCGVRCGLIGTVVIDDGRESARAAMTTPPAIELSRTLATMVEHHCHAVAMEVSSHALDQGRASAIGIDAAVFTNLTGDHLDYHESFEAYRDAKGLLFDGLGEGASAVFMNGTDDGAGMAQRCAPGVDQVWCTLDAGESGNDGWAITVQSQTIEGMRVRLRTPIGDLDAHTRILGVYNAMNLIEAVAAADALLAKLGVDADERVASYIKTLTRMKLPPGRLERVDAEGDTIRVFVDFAHTDDALRSTLAGVRDLVDPTARLWVVFGCGGNRDTTKRARMGAVAADGADRIVVTSDNPRTEKPSKIVDQVLSGIEHSDRYRVEVQVDRAAAIAHAIRIAEPGDVIVIAGKGHETEQILPHPAGGVSTIHFDDREHAYEALRERRLRLMDTEKR